MRAMTRLSYKIDESDPWSRSRSLRDNSRSRACPQVNDEDSDWRQKVPMWPAQPGIILGYKLASGTLQEKMLIQSWERHVLHTNVLPHGAMAHITHISHILSSAANRVQQKSQTISALEDNLQSIYIYLILLLIPHSPSKHVDLRTSLL